MYSQTSHRWQGACVLHAGYLRLQNTHSEYAILMLFYSRAYLGITLHVHCLSCATLTSQPRSSPPNSVPISLLPHACRMPGRPILFRMITLMIFGEQYKPWSPSPVLSVLEIPRQKPCLIFRNVFSLRWAVLKHDRTNQSIKRIYCTVER